MKKEFCKSLSYVLTAALLVGVTLPSSPAAAKKKAPKLNTKKISIKVGQKKTIKVKNASKKATWSIKSGKKVVSLSKKKKASVVVKGKKAGKAVVLAKVAKKKLTCKVTVTKKVDTKTTPTPSDNGNKISSNPTATSTTGATATATATATAPGDTEVTPTPDAGEKATPTPSTPSAGETVQDVVIDMTKVGNTTFSSAGKINFSSQLDSRFDLKYYSEMVVTFETEGAETWTQGKIGLAAEDSQLTGYADGVAVNYGLAPGNTSVTVEMKGDGASGPAYGINIQAADANWSWPQGLSITITGITFVVKEGATYPAEGDPTPTPTATPGPTYAPETFVYEGLKQDYLDKLDPNKPTVAFTFDDGPVGNSETSNSMIIQKALKAHGAHATFFYIGSSINSDEKEDEIRQAVENGFEVGNHSWGWDSLSSKEEQIKDSIGKTNAKLEELTGFSNFLFRAPNLAINNAMKGYIKAPFINCSVDSKDWTGATGDTIYNNVTKDAADGGMDGGIVLMHEFNTKTYEVIDRILDTFIEEGYQVVSVSELFALKGKPLTTGNVYSSTQ